MKKFTASLTALAVALTLGACSDQAANQASTTSPDASAQTQHQSPEFDNVLLQPFPGPYGGVPQFDKMKVEDVKPALRKGMALNLEEIDAIANNPEPPTFDNTIVAMERAGSALDRVFRYYGIFSSNKSSPEFRDVRAEMSPELSAFSTKITQNEALFKRIKAVYESEELKSLTPEEQRITWIDHSLIARRLLPLFCQRSRQGRVGLGLRLLQCR